MSWKDLKVAKKLYIGFGIVLVLALAIGWSGYSGLNTVDEKVSNAEDTNEMVKWVKDTAVLRKDFAATFNVDNLQEIEKILGQMKAQIDVTRARFEDPADVQLIDEAWKQEEKYLAGWRKMVQSEKEVLAAIGRMDAAAEQAGKNVEFLHDGQIKKQFNDISSGVSRSALESRAKKVAGAGDLTEYILEARVHYRDFRRTTEDKYADMLYKSIDQVLAKSDELMAMMDVKADQDAVAAVAAAARDYRKEFETVVEMKHELENAQAELASIGSEVVAAFESLRSGQKAKQEDAQASAVTMAVTFVLGAILIGVFVAFIIARGISRPVSEMARVAEQISRGDVEHDIKLDSKDEIGTLAAAFRSLIDYMKNLAEGAQRIADNDLTVSVEPQSERDVLGNAFQRMVGNLTEMIRQLADNATQLVSAATEIASSSEQMSRGANDQSSQVTQVSTAIEEMSATIVESSKNAGDARDTARGASDTATNGGTIVNDTIQGMQRIATVVRESSESIAKLARSADQIGEIIGVIDDIADQTNLLALNAAIEAARAGEQGRGFAVVADEVRKLAERTGKATSEITDMIKGIQTETSEAVQSMETGIQEVDSGRELADKAGNALTEIVSMSDRVMDMIQQIATAAEEQSAAAEQISRNIEAVSSVTKETATGAEQSAAAAEQLNRQAEGLKQMVAQFRLANAE